MQETRGNRITIIALRLQETGSFHDLYARPFRMGDLESDNLIDRIAERIHDSSGRITESAFHGISSRVLAPDMDVDPRRDRISIVGGFGERRARFSMEVEVETKFGSTDRYYFQGYTDHYGVGSSGSVSDRMNFEINGFIRARTGLRETARGNETVTRVIEMAQIVNGAVVLDENCSTVTRLRPVDLFRDMFTRNIESGYTSGVVDTRTRIASPSDIMFTRRSDSMSDRYLAAAIGTYHHIKEQDSFGYGDEQALTKTQQYLNSELRNMEDNVFLRALANVQGVRRTSHFTLRDLREIDDNIDRPDVLGVGRLSDRARMELATPDNCCDWKSPTIEAQWAVQIANAVSAILMENYHRRLVAEFTNMTHGAQIVNNIHDATPVVDGIPVERLDNVMRQISDFLYDLSYRSEEAFDVFIQANLYDQTLIELKINEQHMCRFWVPSFADSLMNMNFSRSPDRLTELSQDLHGILSRSYSEMSGSRSALETAMASDDNDITDF